MTRADRPKRLWRGAEPIGVLGFHSRVIGIGETARLFAAALKAQGRHVSTIDLAERFQPLLSDPAAEPAWTLSHLNALELNYMVLRRAPTWLRRQPHVGYWVWELETVPRAWSRACPLVDAIWTPSAFSAQAFKRSLRDSPPVTVLPPPIFAAPFEAVERAELGVADDAVSVLAVCDLRSTSARKNPRGAIQAFLEARSKASDSQAVLILKIVGRDAEPAAFAELNQMLEGRSDVRLITESLSDARMIGLIRACDIAVSLHRSEGFGLLAAHAAYAGRAVVATGWSAPLEFLCDDGAALIPFKPVPVNDPQGLYPAHCTWAEPDPAIAADRLVELLVDAGQRKAMGRIAAEHAKARLGRASWHAAFGEAVDQLEAGFQR